jgi:predicted RNA-binding Zn-ribbon protein involved in translation (DUF1610 family)
MKRFVCPKCGSDHIKELSICVVTHEVIKWNDSGQPEDYAQGEVDWESDMPYAALRGPEARTGLTLECSRCGEQFRKAKRIDTGRASKTSRQPSSGA